MIGNIGNCKVGKITFLGIQPKSEKPEKPETTENPKKDTVHLTGKNMYSMDFGMTGPEIREMLLKEDENYADFEFRLREMKHPLATRFSDAHSHGKEIDEMQMKFREMSTAKMSDFINGRCTTDDMMLVFEQIVDEAFDKYEKAGYLGDNNLEKSALLSRLYEYFRYDINTTALMANNAEGAQYVEYNPDEDIYYGKETYCNNHIYYNAEYYYIAKEALTALESKVLEMAETKGIDGYSAPTNLLPMYNNTCMVSIGADPHILDTSKEPPRDFRFFCQERPPVGRIVDKMVLDEDGNVIKRYPDPPKTKAMEYCAIVKVWGGGWQGKARVPYYGNINDFHNLSTVFKGDKAPQEIQDYMANFQFYSHAAQSMKYWADKYGITTPEQLAGHLLGYA